MLKTIEGKWVLFAVATGQQVEHWPVDAKLLLQLGSHTAEPPAGVDVVPPPTVPKYVGAPRAPVATVFEVTEPAASPPGAEPAKKGKKE